MCVFPLLSAYRLAIKKGSQRSAYILGLTLIGLAVGSVLLRGKMNCTVSFVNSLL